MRTIACVATALLAVGVSACAAAQRTDTAMTSSPAASRPAASPSPSQQALGARWQLKWSTSFAQPAPLGSFSGCDNYDRTPAAYCSGLPADVRSQWWAYPEGWPDTAAEAHASLGGYYDPAGTVWISGGQMHIRMFRGSGSIHSAAVVPKAAIAMLYGKYVERFQVSAGGAPGYKSSHLLWPSGNAPNYEVDYPESSWDVGFCIHIHAVHKTTLDYCPAGALWTDWHTTEVDWTPRSLTFYLDGRQIYQATGKYVPDEPMSWILQNETALNGELAPVNSSAQLNISYVAVYSYLGAEG